MFQQIAEIQTLWRGESVAYLNGKGDEVPIKTLPRPIQPTLPVWITAAGNPETFREAGARGYNLLTHLLGQSVEELAAKIAIYRQAWQKNNHSGKGTITLMLHTFVGQNDDEVRELVRQPMREYLASSIGLIAKAAWSFPTFKQKTTNEDGQFSVSHLSQQELDEVLDFSFERYFETSGLFGSVDTCLKTIARLKKIDVDEIACLIDFGVDTETTLAQLPLLNTLREQANLSEPQPDFLADLIKNRRVTHLQCTPSMANLLLADLDTEVALGNIQHLMIGGEAFSESLATRLEQTVSGVIHNMYGPTETTIWSATHSLDPIQSGAVPLGRPIANTELYVLDRQLQPVPLGVAGELFIGGKGVTRGYLNRPELTQERFIPNPFEGRRQRAEGRSFSSSDTPYSLLYKTGDLVRYRADGSLEFLGRADFQVKVRGYRIELGEIETLLCRHETVREAVVVVREDLPGDKRLVAYVLPQERPVESSLREYLGSRLPEYMVPSHIVFLKSFPLTPNNKIDRQALPAPIEVTQHQETSVATAQTPLEKTLVEIWREVLQISQLGVNDNFFDLGGNSLIAVSLIGKIRSAFKIELPLLALFQAPTIGLMTDRIENLLVEQSQEASLLDERTILPRANSDSAPLSFAQERLWFIDQLETDSSFYNISRAVRLNGILNIRVLRQALDAIAAYHKVLYTNYISEEAKPIQVIAAPRSVELQIINLQQYGKAERETQVQNLLQQESQRPFDLTSDMMLRGCLLQLASQEQILLLVMHHIASDDWSVGILWEQLTQVYRAFLENKPNPLQPLSIQYADYAVWKRNWLSNEVLEQYLEYWKRQLAGANPVLELPTDRPRPTVKTYRGAHQSLTLSQNLSESLKRLCR